VLIRQTRWLARFWPESSQLPCNF